uniref:RNA-dependent RNA polymerase n=1 Tax=Picornavirales sp. TaxID=1955153 RepID=A0A514D5X3_9VIRU|nr:MAG: RNA-dependent RNA polymerase [Picornavirales sp.]
MLMNKEGFAEVMDWWYYAHIMDFVPLWKVSGKIEILKIKKLWNKDIRIFEIPPLPFAAYGMRMCQDFNERLHHMWATGPIAVGAVMQRGGFHKLLMSCDRCGTKGACDCKKWDKHYLTRLRNKCRDIRVNLYKQTQPYDMPKEEYAIRMNWYYGNCTSGYFVTPWGQIFQAEEVILSGDINTSPDNTMGHLIGQIAYVLETVPSCKNYREVFDIFFPKDYADDNIFSTKPEFNFLADFPRRSEFYTRFGQELKEEDDFVSDNWDGIPFLGAIAVRYLSQYVPSYNADRIYAGLRIKPGKMRARDIFQKALSLLLLSTFSTPGLFQWIRGYCLFLQAKFDMEYGLFWSLDEGKIHLTYGLDEDEQFTIFDTWINTPFIPDYGFAVNFWTGLECGGAHQSSRPVCFSTLQQGTKEQHGSPISQLDPRSDQGNHRRQGRTDCPPRNYSRHRSMSHPEPKNGQPKVKAPRTRADKEKRKAKRDRKKLRIAQERLAIATREKYNGNQLRPTPTKAKAGNAVARAGGKILGGLPRIMGQWTVQERRMIMEIIKSLTLPHTYAPVRQAGKYDQIKTAKAAPWSIIELTVPTVVSMDQAKENRQAWNLKIDQHLEQMRGTQKRKETPTGQMLTLKDKFKRLEEDTIKAGELYFAQFRDPVRSLIVSSVQPDEAQRYWIAIVPYTEDAPLSGIAPVEGPALASVLLIENAETYAQLAYCLPDPNTNAVGGFPCRNHGDFMGIGECEENRQASLVWLDESTVVTIITSAAPMDYRLCLDRWTPDSYIENVYTASFAALSTGGDIAIGTRGYYGFRFTEASASNTLEYSLRFNAPSTGTVVFRHLCLADYPKNIISAPSIKVSAVGMCLTNTSPTLTNGGSLTLFQAPPGETWSEHIEAKNTELQGLEGSKTQRNAQGGYMFMKPGEDSDFFYIKDTIVHANTLMRSRYQVGGIRPVIMGWGKWADPATTTLYACPAWGVEYPTTDTWKDVAVPGYPKVLWDAAIEHIGRMEQFYENPKHISEILGDLKRYAASFVNGILKYGPNVLEGAAMFASFL